MPRKGLNIYKRKDGRWEGRYLKEHTDFRKPHYGYVYGKTYGEVKDLLLERQINERLYSHNQVCKGSVPYSDILSNWLESKRIVVKDSTYARYYQIINSRLIPSLGQVPTSRISTSLIENYITGLIENGRTDGNGGLSPKTASDILCIIKASIAFMKVASYEERFLCPEKHTVLLLRISIVLS